MLTRPQIGMLCRSKQARLRSIVSCTLEYTTADLAALISTQWPNSINRKLGIKASWQRNPPKPQG
jgi:hypothetical protein